MAPPMVLGLQMSVCNLEFSIYYGHQLCCGPATPCPEIPEVLEPPSCWLVHALPIVVPSSAVTNTNVVGLPNHNFSLVKAISNWPELLWTGQADSLLFEKVRATSFILLLGVGSFVCYRIFHHFKCRLENKKKYSTTCKKLYSKGSLGNKYSYIDDNSSDLSSISEVSVLESNSSYDDQLSTSDSFSINDDESEELAMGIFASHHVAEEPVRYNKISGVVFKKSDSISTPLLHVSQNIGDAESAERLNSKRTINKRQLLSDSQTGRDTLTEDKENELNASGSFGEADGLGDPFNFDQTKYMQDTMSLKGNFSPGSLHERVIKAEEYWNLSQEQREWSNPSLQRPNSLNLSSNSKYLKRQYSNDSFSIHSDSRGEWPMSRTFSIDSQISELAPELQPQAEEIGCVAVERIETLQTELLDLKQTVLDLDAEFVQLKVYKRPPERCWELTNISLSDSQTPISEDLLASCSILDVVQHHKAKMWYKGLLDSRKLKKDSEDMSKNSSILDKNDEVRWDLVSRRLLDWDLDAENTFDSGSDFGNSLETDSVDLDGSSAAPISLEWDSDGIYETDAKLPKSNDLISELDGKTTDKTTTSSDSSASEALRSRSRSQKRKHLRRRNSSLDSYVTQAKLNRTKSNSGLSEMLSDQIQRVIGAKNSGEDQSPSVVDFSPMSRTSEISCSAQPSASIRDDHLVEEDESGFHEKQLNGNGDTNEEEIGNQRFENNRDSNGNVTDFEFDNQEIRGNWDSAYCEGSDFPDSPQSSNIGEVISVSAYIGSLSQNNLVKGFEAVATNLNVSQMRRIRGDKSCIVRATIFHLLTQKHSLLQRYGGASMVYQALTSWSQTSCPWLVEWSFANKIPYGVDNCLKGFWECLRSLQEMEETLKTTEDPSSFLAEALNNDPDLDTKLIESVKLLMVVGGLKLHEDLLEGKGDGSVLHLYAMLLFGRDVCSEPKDLVIGQLDKVGNTIQLDQVGLYLLGHSLCASLEIVRPHLANTASFVTTCPDWNRQNYPAIVLATEDERNFWLFSR